MAVAFIGKGLGTVAAVAPQAITPAVFLVSTYRILLEDMSFINELPEAFKSKLKNIIFFDKNYKKIRNLQDAKENKYNLSPSPIQLSKKILQGSKLKPIKVRKKQRKLYLSEGRLRFWAYVIAYGWNYSIKVILK